MKTWKSLSKSGRSAVLFAGVLVLVTGCVQERVIVHQPSPYPVAIQVPDAPTLPPVTPPPIIELPPAPPPAPVVLLRSAPDLDRMLGPIALYPDPLLAQLLPAATFPEQVVLADRYVRQGGDVNQVDFQPWDNSIKALARYPATLRMLDDNLGWTTDLGQAFLNQPADVMNSVQRLRAQARAVGNLQSTPQQTVVIYGGLIEIVPAKPQVIYVPVYQPEVVYVQRPPVPGRIHISFGSGLVVGGWLNHDCDWEHHQVIVWHHDHPRPTDWWYRAPEHREKPVVINNVTVVNNTIVNQNVTVWHPRTGGAISDRGDRGWGSQQARLTGMQNNEAAMPERREVRQQSGSEKPVREASITQREIPQPPATRANAQGAEVKPAPVLPPRQTRDTSPRNEAVSAPSRTQEQARTQTPLARTSIPDTQTAARSPINPSLDSSPRRLLPQPQRGNQAIAAPKDPRPAPSQVARPSSAPAVSTRSAARPVAPPRVATGNVRGPTSALVGIESPQATREASVRGQQSRQAITRPVTAVRPASAPAPSPRGSSNTKKPGQVREN